MARILTSPVVTEAPWRDVFWIDGQNGGAVKLEQLDRQTFLLKSRIEYRGETGLEGKIDPAIIAHLKVFDPLPDGYETDLASVPGPTRWFLGAYGSHTPAVLFHDRLIPTPADLADMKDEYADRYMRFMLQALGVRWLKRWIMWTAVAMRTRWAAGGWKMLSVAAWAVIAVLGIATFIVGPATGNTALVIAAIVAPLPASLLWGGQFGAGLIAAATLPWFLPPTALAVLGYAVYVAIESGVGRFQKVQQRGTGTIAPEGI